MEAEDAEIKRLKQELAESKGKSLTDLCALYSEMVKAEGTGSWKQKGRGRQQKPDQTQAQQNGGRKKGGGGGEKGGGRGKGRRRGGAKKGANEV